MDTSVSKTLHKYFLGGFWDQFGHQTETDRQTDRQTDNRILGHFPDNAGLVWSGLSVWPGASPGFQENYRRGRDSSRLERLQDFRKIIAGVGILVAWSVSRISGKL